VNPPVRSASQSSQLLLWTVAALLSACGGASPFTSGTSAGSTGTATTPSGSSAPAPNPTPAPISYSTSRPTAYSLSKLVSNGAIAAALTDAQLVNPRGIVFAPNAPVWVADNGSQTSTAYDGIGTPRLPAVAMPVGMNGAADPTGIVSNGGSQFVINEGVKSAPAQFIFDGEGGTISGWSSAVDAQKALVMYEDGSGGAVYTGLAIATDGTGTTRLYAADFHNNKVDVFDGNFAKTTTIGGFSDPTLPTGYAPFGIQTLVVQNQTLIYVAYAKQDSAARADVVGTGLGLVDVFDTQGTLKTHLIATGGALDSPWGMALAPAEFGTFSNTLLIGDFGDGWINAYDPASGEYVGSLSDSTGQPIAIPGLWGIAFGNGALNQPTTTLFFAAGLNDGAGGLYGRIDPGPSAPDVIAPSAILTSPAPGATASGTVILIATANDNVAVTRVRFLAGSTVIGTASTAPYSVSWDTTTAANGNVTLTVQAQDAAGNVGTSSGVAVTVNNAAPGAAATN
jgi:uncharacterized protein (TIGR03118 family)